MCYFHSPSTESEIRLNPDGVELAALPLTHQFLSHVILTCVPKPQNGTEASCNLVRLLGLLMAWARSRGWQRICNDCAVGMFSEARTPK
jgi:hypothetical protein